MKKRLLYLLIVVFILSSCHIFDNGEVELDHESTTTLIDELVDTNYFRNGSLEHILEGVVNRNNQAVGFHYNQLSTKKGEIVRGTKTATDEHGVYEAKVIVNDIERQGNNRISSFFLDDWDAQECR